VPEASQESGFRLLAFCLFLDFTLALDSDMSVLLLMPYLVKVAIKEPLATLEVFTSVFAAFTAMQKSFAKV